MTPDFAEWLLKSFPKSERTGLVFNPCGTQGARLTGSEAGRYVSTIGRRAGVEIKPGSGKFATCHDFRRSFGTRWSRRVMPAELKMLMRHADVETTMKYCVDIDSDHTAELWARFSSEESITTKQDTTEATVIQS